MPIELISPNQGDYLHIRMTGKLSREDYERFVPDVERRIAEKGKLTLLVEMIDFHGWDLPALWEDIKFDAKHFNDVQRLAMVGDKAWEKWMTIFCKPFTTARCRFFGPGELVEARRWVAESKD